MKYNKILFLNDKIIAEEKNKDSWTIRVLYGVIEIELWRNGVVERIFTTETVIEKIIGDEKNES